MLGLGRLRGGALGDEPRVLLGHAPRHLRCIDVVHRIADGALRREGVEGGVSGAKAVWLESDGALTAVVEDDRTAEILHRLELIEQRLAG